jgi:hypothetical protein
MPRPGKTPTGSGLWGARGTAVAALLLSGPWCGVCRAEEDLAALWGNTAAAAANAGAGSGLPTAWSVICSLLVVFGLLWALAWALKRWRPGLAPAAAPARTLFFGRFNAVQTLRLSARGAALRCEVLRGRRVELDLELPDVLRLAGGAPAPGARGAAPAGFAEIWRQLLQGGKR